MKPFRVIINRAMPLIKDISLIKQICIAIVLAIIAALLFPSLAVKFEWLGTLFITALKSVAPVLVFFLIMSAIANQSLKNKTEILPILVMYLVGTVTAALSAVIISFIFPVTLSLDVAQIQQSSPSSIGAVIFNLFNSLVDNPIHAMAAANYLGILAWATGFGLSLRNAKTTSRQMVSDLADCVSVIVKIIIRFAPLGIFSLVLKAIVTEGFSGLGVYISLLGVLLGAMVFTVLVLNPIIVFWCIRQNPYPLIFQVLRDSGISAFFTRSSAANIPINLALCKKLGLDETTYGISIPLGATINMSGAAITITVFTLAACHTLNIPVTFGSALILSILASFGACGAAGVPGGSLMLIPLACNLFGISNDISSQLIAIGFIVSVVQDSSETALNSSGDVLFTTAACLRAARLKGRAS